MFGISLVYDLEIWYHRCIIIGLQEATGELVSKLTNDMEQKQKKKTADKTSASNGEPSPVDAVGFTSEPFEFEYTFKVEIQNVAISNYRK